MRSSSAHPLPRSWVCCLPRTSSDSALILFLLFYLKFIGRHSWPLSIVLTVAIPVSIFCLFEWALKIPLPKEITEPLFYPIYDLMYS